MGAWWQVTIFQIKGDVEDIERSGGRTVARPPPAPTPPPPRPHPRLGSLSPNPLWLLIP